MKFRDSKIVLKTTAPQFNDSKIVWVSRIEIPRYKDSWDWIALKSQDSRIVLKTTAPHSQDPKIVWIVFDYNPKIQG